MLASQPTTIQSWPGLSEASSSLSAQCGSVLMCERVLLVHVLEAPGGDQRGGNFSNSLSNILVALRGKASGEAQDKPYLIVNVNEEASVDDFSMLENGVN
eukprot:g36860.t1